MRCIERVQRDAAAVSAGAADPRAVRGAGGAHAAMRWRWCARGSTLSYARTRTRGRISWRGICVDEGVGPDERVAICAWSAVCEMLVGVLGILKAGGAYVPLDPGYPGGAPGVHAGGCRAEGVADAGAAARRAAGYASKVIALDGEWSADRARTPARTSLRPSVGWTAVRSAGLRHLHLRLDRSAQGRDDRASCAW